MLRRCATSALSACVETRAPGRAASVPHPILEVRWLPPRQQGPERLDFAIPCCVVNFLPSLRLGKKGRKEAKAGACIDRAPDFAPPGRATLGRAGEGPVKRFCYWSPLRLLRSDGSHDSGWLHSGRDGAAASRRASS